jgi:hypothetical protein
MVMPGFLWNPLVVVGGQKAAAVVFIVGKTYAFARILLKKLRLKKHPFKNKNLQYMA